MMISDSIKNIDIRPGVSILSILQHLNYRPWFAIAEFVDNSLQSYLIHKSDLQQTEGDEFKLKVWVEINNDGDGYIRIRDNAAGIHHTEFVRAFRPAELPIDRSGLCEFGMGMKSAACWFAPNWYVRTKALGENVERKVEFDISKIVNDNIEELNVNSAQSNVNYHYTEIYLFKLHKPPQNRTVSKIKEHLASIYRQFIEEKILELHFIYNGDDEVLNYHRPKILIAPFYKDPLSENTEWKKDISFDLGLGLKVRGFAALRETASVSGAGFSLFRRGRLIEGSADEGYRPEIIFKKSNSYTYQRLFGELHLEGFDVSHTKDGFRWEENEEPFLELLKEELNRLPLQLLDQAEGYRARIKPNTIFHEADKVVNNTAEVVQTEIPPIFDKQIESDPETQNPPPQLPSSKIITTSDERKIILDDFVWTIRIELTNDPSISDWFCLSYDDTVNKRLGISVSLAHPFTDRFCGPDASGIEPLLRLAIAIGLAEVTARESGVKNAGTIRRNINEYLRDALSKP